MASISLKSIPNSFFKWAKISFVLLAFLKAAVATALALLKSCSFVKDTLNLAVSINGKKRAEFEISSSASKEEILVFAKENTAKWLEGKSIVKEIYVEGKLVNLVIK